MSLKYCVFYSKTDLNKEALGKSNTSSRLEAAKEFAQMKQLPLKEFLKIWSVEKRPWLSL
jgi:hypothetical protein